MSSLTSRPLDEQTKQFVEQARASDYDFHKLSVKAAGDEKLRTAVGGAVLRQYTGRQLRLLDLPDSDKLRSLAGEIKQHALDHLDAYLEQFQRECERNGGHVHFAATAEDARRIVTDIARRAGATRCIKSKSMASEEIDLAHALESAGVEVVETDLGEFIVQVSHDRPSHLVAPIVHKDRASIAKVFSEYFGEPCDDDPRSLTMRARQHLRGKFRTADFGITGGNFIVAQTGQVCCVENEGNQRQSITTPRLLVSVVGIEKMVPRLTDLAVMLKLLARSATGQPVTIYTNLFGGPRNADERDGPQEFHVVLIDNGRTEVLASEQYRETLRCIRCGACLNACPIYRSIGGHAYGSVYPGPIGALITPLMQGLRQFQDLPQASSLCGACYEACPVKIDIPRHLIALRKDMVDQKIKGPVERTIYRLWAKSLLSPTIYRLVNRLQRIVLRRQAKKTGGWVSRLPPVAAGWTDVRDLPAPAPVPFHQLWKKRSRSATGPRTGA
jgi:L-lactate dehydrogenase complex protein LldF